MTHRPSSPVPASGPSTDRAILRLAVPSIVSNITVPLLGLVDLAIVGHLQAPGGSGRYIAAIAVGTMIFNVMYWLFGFLRMGTSGLTAQALGRGDWAGVGLLLRRSVRTALAIAACFVVLQWPLGWLALTLIHPSAQVWPLAGRYFDIVIWGAPAMLTLYSLNGWFVGMQTTRVPMQVALFQNVVNIVASVAFVFGLGLRIEGVALGTLVAQWSGVGLAAWHARRMWRSAAAAHGMAAAPRDCASEPHGASAAVEPAHGARPSFFRVNRDIFLRTLCLVAVNLFFTSAGARQGDMVLAVNTLLMTFFTLFSYVMDGFAFAGEALGGRLYGAGDGAGLRRLVRRLFVWGAGMMAVFTAVYALGGTGFLGLLTSDGAVVQAAAAYLPWACLVPVAGIAAFVYDGIFIGLAATRGMLVSSVAATAAFFAVFAGGGAVLAGGGAGVFPAAKAATSASSPMLNHFLWLAFLVYLAARGLLQHLIFRHHRSLRRQRVG